MPLKNGYGKNVVSANIREMVKAGRPQKQAVAAAHDKAKREFKRKNPNKSLPAHLKRGGKK